jgi:hypothetical protein
LGKRIKNPRGLRRAGSVSPTQSLWEQDFFAVIVSEYISQVMPHRSILVLI